MLCGFIQYILHFSISLGESSYSFDIGDILPPLSPRCFLENNNQLLVPTVFFYLLYFLFYVGLWFGRYRIFVEFDTNALFDVFDLYSGSESFTKNPPLLFIFDLLFIQLVMYGLLKLI